MGILGKAIVTLIFAAVGGGSSLYLSRKLDKGWKVPTSFTFGGKSYDIPVIGGVEFDAGWATALLGVGAIAIGAPVAGLALMAGTAGAQAPNVVASKWPELIAGGEPAQMGAHGVRGLPKTRRVSEEDVKATLDRFAAA